MAIFKQYKGVGKMFRRYWDAYGGMSAIISSPYLHAAFLFTLLMTGTCLTPGWWEQVISVMPNLTGFTLGGFAIIVTFGDDDFKKVVYTKFDEEEHSFVATIGATFVHFVLLQVLSLILALASKSTFFVLNEHSRAYQALQVCTSDVTQLLVVCRSFWWFISYGIFLYALLTTIAATFAIFRLVYNYQSYLDTKED